MASTALCAHHVEEPIKQAHTYTWRTHTGHGERTIVGDERKIGTGLGVYLVEGGRGLLLLQAGRGARAGVHARLRVDLGGYRGRCGAAAGAASSRADLSAELTGRPA